MAKYSRPPRLGTSLQGERAEEIKKKNKNSKVKVLSPEEIEAYLEEKKLKEEKEKQEAIEENERLKGKKI